MNETTNSMSSYDDVSRLSKVFFILGASARKLPLILFCSTALTALDLLGISLILPYVSALLEPQEIVNSEYYLKLIEFGAPADSVGFVGMLSLVICVLFLFKAVFGILLNRMILKFCFYQGAELRGYLMQSYSNLPLLQYLQRNSSEYIYNMQHLVNQFSQTVLQSGMRIVSEGLVVLAIVGFIAYQSLTTLFAIVALFVVALGAYDKVFRRLNLKFGNESNNRSDEIIKLVQEGIEGIREIRVLGVSHFFQNSLKQSSVSYAEAMTNAQLISQMPKYILELLLILGVVAAVFLNIDEANSFADSLPMIAALAFAALRVLPSINQILSSSANLRFSSDAIDRLYSDISWLNQHAALDAKPIGASEVNAGQDTAEPFEKLQLNNVSFSYPGTARATLKNLEFSLSAGETVGLVGPSGSGKSTLLNILIGLLDVSSGEIAINGRDLSITKDFWWSKIAYLPQQIFLIDGSLQDNIALGVKPEDVDETNLQRAIEQAKLKELVMSLPRGLHTHIGDRGSKLSGGQRQRVAIARAFYFKKEVIILDEATSSLDSQVESEIVDELLSLKGETTMLVVAHRISTLQGCDRILALESSRLKSDVSYDALMAESFVNGRDIEKD